MAEILVIDDEPQMRRLIRRILVPAGYSVREAEDGLEGLRLFRERRPALVITDIIMPVGEGIETIRTLHREAPAMPIVAISADAPSLYLRAAAELGAAASLLKPFAPADLLAAVGGLLAGAAEGNGPQPATAEI